MPLSSGTSVLKVLAHYINHNTHHFETNHERPFKTDAGICAQKHGDQNDISK